MSTTTTQVHGRGGSHQVGFMGGMVMRECTCGQTFTGSGPETFAQREQHIADANR